jgi:iron complex outermembrane receptor protein
MNLKRLFVAMALSLFAFIMQAGAQDKVVTGKVTDATGAAVPEATIKIKGGKALGKTNSDGTFSVKAPGNGVLEFSSVGFTTVEMQVPASGVMNVSIKSGNENLNEVVVIGYGTAKKKDLTGSVVSISSKDFVKGIITTPEQLIAGKVAGVAVTPNGGAPGSGSTIRIRGGASLSGSNDPLIVIDGVIIDNNGISGSANALNLINPNDIESFNILKDASATAIYGSRASAGVIIITTKRGKIGKPTFNFSSTISAFTPGKQIDVLSAKQFSDFVKANGGASDVALLGTANTNWQDEIFKTAIGVDNNLSMSGAIFKKVPFRASIGYLNQQGTLRGGSLKRTSASVVISPKFFKDHLKVDVNLRGVVSENNFANEGAIGAAVSFDPTKPVNSNSKRFGGYWEWLDPNSTTGLKSLAPLNPLGLLNQRSDKSHVERSIGNIQFDYKFHGFEDLKAVVNMGYDVSKGTGNIVINDSAAMSYKRHKDENGKFHGGVNNIYRQEKTNLILDAYLNYVKEISIGRFDATVGYSYNDFKTTDYNYTDNTTDGSITGPPPAFDYNIPRNTIVSVYGRLNYSYKGKYLLTASARKDGSSKFSKANRWGVFPSVAVGWRIKDESFLKNVAVINDLKLRASYGLTGQQGIGSNYLYQQNYYLSGNQSLYQFGNSFYNLYAPGGFNAAIKWEDTKTLNVGVDFSILKNRVSGSIEFYEKKTEQLFAPAQQPAGSNFTNTIDANIGSMTNSGVDFNVNLGMIRKKDLTWDVAFNINYNKNEITNLTLNNDPNYLGNLTGGISGGTGQTVQINSVGYAHNAFYVFKQVYDQKTGKPIDGLYDDINRDGTINSSDLYRYKQPDPLVFMGLSSSVNYKNWNAGFVARANVGNYIYNNVASNTGTRRNIINPIGVLNNGSTEVLNSGFSGNGSNYYLSDYWIQNASFIRIDNINIGYNVGKVFNNKANLRLSANVQNAFVITKYKGLDPEQNGGIDNNLYSRPRVFVLGLGLDF